MDAWLQHYIVPILQHTEVADEYIFRDFSSIQL